MILISNIIMAVSVIAKTLLDVYFWIVIVATIVSWVRPDPYNSIVRWLSVLTEPVFYQVRKLLPFCYTRGIDFSPLVVLIAIQLIQMVVLKTLIEWSVLLK